MKKKKIIVFAVAFVVLLSCIAFQSGFDSFDEMVNAQLKKTVPTITTDELKMKTGQKNQINLLDTRELDEYNVSHIPGARWVGYNHFNLFALNDLKRTDTVIVYCSIGVRSERIGEKLKKAGYKNVYNLFGGIFRWVNSGYAVVDHRNQSTQKIHPYSEKWGKWLTKGIKSYE